MIAQTESLKTLALSKSPRFLALTIIFSYLESDIFDHLKSANKASKQTNIMQKSNQYDVIVVGVGGIGSATCYQLAKRGAKVLGLEQFDIPHNQGSSHGLTLIIRLVYFENTSYIPLFFG